MSEISALAVKLRAHAAIEDAPHAHDLRAAAALLEEMDQMLEHLTRFTRLFYPEPQRIDHRESDNE